MAALVQVTMKSAKPDGSCFFHSLKPIFSQAGLPVHSVNDVRRTVADAVTDEDVAAATANIADPAMGREKGDGGTTSLDLARSLVAAGYDVGAARERLVAAMRRTKTLDENGAVSAKRFGARSLWASGELDVRVGKRVLAECGFELVTTTAVEEVGGGVGVDLAPVMHLGDAVVPHLPVAVVACDNWHYWTVSCAGSVVAPMSEWLEAARAQKAASEAAEADRRRFEQLDAEDRQAEERDAEGGDAARGSERARSISAQPDGKSVHSSGVEDGDSSDGSGDDGGSGDGDGNGVAVAVEPAIVKTCDAAGCNAKPRGTQSWCDVHYAPVSWHLTKNHKFRTEFRNAYRSFLRDERSLTAGDLEAILARAERELRLVVPRERSREAKARFEAAFDELVQ